MTNNCCLLCGHHESWHILSGECFCEWTQDCSDEECKFIKEQCKCPSFCYDIKVADKLYKELQEKGIRVG